MFTRKPSDDDFVLTISDHEDGIPDLDGLSADPSAVQGASVNKKRKRGNGAAYASDKRSSGENKVKKSKQGNGFFSASSDEDEDTSGKVGEDDGAIDSDFEFQLGDDANTVSADFDGWAAEPGQDGKDRVRTKTGVDIDSIIARRKAREPPPETTNGGTEDGETQGDESAEEEDNFLGFNDEDEYLEEDAFGMGVVDQESGDDVTKEAEESATDEEADGESDAESVAMPVPHPDDVISDASENEEDPAELQRRSDFFAPEEIGNDQKGSSVKPSGSFQSMSLSRPVLRGLATVGFSEPTPIQSKTIPLAMQGKDIVGGAVTGSGKTAAFVIPIIERLLYRPKKVPTTRVVILTPTRELAVQCFNVTKKLATFTDITFAQIVGGFSLREQEQVLRRRPDVVIATPGRFIDHMRNSASFAVDSIEILVLDEADRMLEDGFADELNEILKTIPKSRQTMLFSATMTDSVDKLIRVGLNRPVRLIVDAKRQTVSGLVQEFVRLRPGREGKRLAYLMYLCENVYTDRAIIFFRQKREAHRVRVVFGLCGFKAAELHGSMSQEQRIQSVESFRSGQVSFLLATDLASRGLDIKNVSTVINYSAPQSHEIYLHRVGRTARAGRSGRACTIAAEPDRKVVKAAVKSAHAQGARVQSRVVPNDVADAWAVRLAEMVPEVDAVLADEMEEKAMNDADRDVRRVENIVKYEDEIKSRPRRTWFESEQEKAVAKQSGKTELNGVAKVEGGKKKRKLSGKEKKRLDGKDERVGGHVWKKGAAERAGKGALEKKEAGTKGNRKGKKARKPTPKVERKARK